MIPKSLKMYAQPRLENPRMVLGFSGWMDGGEVSTGTVDYLTQQTEARKLAEIVPDDFYIYNFPGSMEFSSLFRPMAYLNEGLVANFQEPENFFYYDEANQLILFEGKEPNLRWHEFADCIFALTENCHCEEIYFVGSFAGLVPHTREPRFTCSVSLAELKRRLEPYNIRYSSYQGPAGFSTFLTRAAGAKGLAMINLVAEIPAYVEGRNPRCIEAMVKYLATLLKLQVNLEEMRLIADELEKKLNKVIEDKEELQEHIQKLEENYDKEVFDADLGDLKTWLERQGIRLD
jgi:proteasome assembly chaperone (PAC2) family protein